MCVHTYVQVHTPERACRGQKSVSESSASVSLVFKAGPGPDFSQLGWKLAILSLPPLEPGLQGCVEHVAWLVT